MHSTLWLALPQAISLGLSEIAEVADVSLDNLRTNLGDGGQAAGDAFRDGFSSAFEAGKVENILDGFGAAVLDRARQNRNAADEDLLFSQSPITTGDRDPAGPTPPGSGSGTGSGGSSTVAPDFASEIAKIQQQIELEKQFGLQKEITNKQLEIEKALKRDLTDVERELLSAAVTALEVAKERGAILEEIQGPQEQLRITQQALNELFAEGAITLEQYNTKLRETQIAALNAQNTLGGGFKAAILSAQQSAGEFGNTLGNFVVGAAGKAADAIVEFAKTGKFNIRQFFQDLFAQLLKLAANQLFKQLLGGLFGGAGGGAGGLLGGLFGFNQGGSILPSFAGGGTLGPIGPGSTDSQTVAFNKRPDERVDILTPPVNRPRSNAK